MSIEADSDSLATPDDVRRAIDALTEADTLRLEGWASFCLWGTEYQHPQELINEAVARTYLGASSDEGRHWKTNVPFVAYLMRTVESIASASYGSVYMQRTRSMETLATEAMEAEDVLSTYGHHHDDVPTQAIEAEELQDRQADGAAKAAKIEAYFAGDQVVMWIFEGRKEGWTPKEIRENGNLDQRAYDSALQRIWRGIKKISF